MRHRHGASTKTPYGPRQAIKCLRTCAKCTDSDHPAHAQTNMRTIALHSYILLYPKIILANREGPDQTARMRRLIWASLSAYAQKHVFAWRSPCDNDKYPYEYENLKFAEKSPKIIWLARRNIEKCEAFANFRSMFLIFASSREWPRILTNTYECLAITLAANCICKPIRNVFAQVWEQR